MSRSNPTEHSPHPCYRWIEWNGAEGHPKYYDKAKEENVDLPCDFTFIVLDVLSTIKGWHDASDSGIYSNEVKDIRDEPFVVKAFKGGMVAEGFYKQIKDRVKAAGGKFTANIYMVFKNDDKDLVLGSIQFSGAALNAWVDFQKENRDAVQKKAVRIKGYTEGKKGKIVYRVPKFQVSEIADETNAEAIEIDKALQAFLKTYFARTRGEQAHPVDEPEHHAPKEDRQRADVDEEPDDVPF